MNLNSIVCGSDGCSLPRLLGYMEEVGVEIPSYLREYNFEPVVDIIDTGEIVPMYDLSVYNDDHQFMASGIACHNSWKTPITQSEGIEWVNMQLSNQDMQFNVWLEYLIKVGCAVFLIDPAEINFDLHGGVQQTPLFESSQEWKLKASRDRGLKPLLRFIANLINVHVIDKIDDHFVFEFAGLDELTEQEKHEMLKEQIATYMTLNEGRRSLDMPDLGDIGDLPMNPTLIQALQFLDQKQQAEKQQEMEAKQAEAEAGQEQPQEEVPPDFAMKQEAHQQKMQQEAEKHPLEMQRMQQQIDQANAVLVEGGQEGVPAEGAPVEEAPQDSRRAYSDLANKSIDFDQFIEAMRARDGDDKG